jgi:hypothetical protein
MIGRPSYQDFLGIMKNNLLPNISISVNDIMNDEKIFGKDLGSLQGRTIRERPEVVKTSYIDLRIEIMEIHGRVTLAMDIMNVDRMYFLITSSRNIQFITVYRLENKYATTLKEAIKRVLNLYNKRGFKMEICLADNEFEILRDLRAG